jgi:hypothetical protein
MAEASAGALQIVQTQQAVVGKTIMGGARCYCRKY